MWVLSILQQSPKNGAEIMDQIEMASQGWWRPSPGSVYPLLEELEKDGSAKRREDGKYELTGKGREEFEWPWGMPPKQPRTVEEIANEVNGYISYLEDLSKSDKSRVAPYANLLSTLKDRLTTLLDSL
jgi:DNA-binding PadR family transcriptional regulator